MARPAFWKVDRPEEAGVRASSTSTATDALVEAAQARPGPVRRPLPEVPGPGVQLRLLRARATITRPRTPPSGRSCRRSRNLARFEERARPADGEGASTFRVWLFQIARNVGRRTPPPSAPPSRGAARGGRVRRRPARHRGRRRPPRRGQRRRWRAVGRLPDDRRRALILRFVDEMSTAEIAGVLGRSEGAVRVLIHRALRSVARDLDDRDPMTGAFAGRDGRRDRRPRHRPLPRRAPRRARRAAPITARHRVDPGRSGPRGRPTASRATCRDSIRRSGSRRRSRPGSPRSPPRCAAAAPARGVGLAPPRRRRAPTSGAERSRLDVAARTGRCRRCRTGRPLLIGGALTSAALSLAGAAYVAWRLRSPGRHDRWPARPARVARSRPV